MSFYSYLNSDKDLLFTKNISLQKNDLDERYIKECKPGLKTFSSLISKAASPFIEEMAVRSRMITEQRFGKTIRLYAPIYISNECSNDCLYCGFRKSNKFERRTLDNDEVMKEVDILLSKGLRHILLVAGETTPEPSAKRIVEITKLIKKKVPAISIEVAPFSVKHYSEIVNAGVEGLTIYQETYDEKLYDTLHPSGKKKDFKWRLDAPERGIKAGIRRVNIGILLGLAKDWRKDSLRSAMHIDYLMKHYWRVLFAVSIPRLCECQGEFVPETIISDKELSQLIFAYRIAFPDIGISLSTREPEYLRDGLTGLGVTYLSAESSTEPGGYSDKSETLSGKQFLPHDARTVKEISAMLSSKDIDPVWKDWDACLFGN